MHGIIVSYKKNDYPGSSYKIQVTKMGYNCQYCFVMSIYKVI